MVSAEDEELRKSVAYTNLTDWFLHEGRNAFVTHIKDPSLHWSPQDYDRGREQLLGVLDAFERFPDAGTLTKGEVRKFIEETTQEIWNATTIDGLWEQFKLLSDKATKDY